MNEITLVTRPVGNDLTQTVNARTLHENLGVKRDFNTWVKAQVERARLKEGRDFVTAENLSTPKKGSSKAREQQTIEYHLTIDAAKHISMMSNTDKGFEIREYFIKVEQQAMAARLANEERHSADAELGAALKRAIRMEDYDNAAELDKTLDKLDFLPAARVQGVSVDVLRRQVASQTAATLMLAQLERGEHQHESPVRDVVQWGRSSVMEEDTRARMLENRRARTKALTLEQIEVHELTHKHDKASVRSDIGRRGSV